MKQIIISLVIFILYPVISIQLFSQSNTQINLLQHRDGDEKFKKERDAWIEQMHRIEPGINWRIIDKETKYNKAVLRQGKLKSSLLKNPEILNEDEEIAGGLIKGNWIERGSNNCAGRIHTADIDFERNLIYAASSGGNIWRGTLEGENWQCLNNSFQISNIRMVKIINKDSINRIVVVGNNSHLYFSDNEGLTWDDAKGLENVQKWGGIKRGIVTGDIKKVIYLISNEWDYENWKNPTKIYKSEDFGENFTEVLNMETSIDNCDIWGDEFTKGNIYFVNNDSISKIDLNGEITFIGIIDMSQYISSSFRLFLKGSFYKESKELVIFATDWNNTYVFRSTDEGANWNYRGEINFGPFDNNSMAVSVTNPNVMFFGGVELYYSFNGGISWNSRNYWGDYYGNIADVLHADIPGVDVFKDPQAEADYTLISTDGGIYISPDNAVTVYNLSMNGLNVSQYYSTYTDKKNYNKVYAGSQDQGLQRCLLDSGQSLAFEQIISGDYGHLCSSDSGKTLWSVYPGFAHIYTDFDRTNTKRSSWDFEFLNHLWMPPVIEDPNDHKSAYIAAGGNNDKQKICHLTLYGETILPDYLPYVFNSTDNATLSALAISSLDKSNFYAMTDNGKFFYSTDFGEEWDENEQFDGPDAHYFYGSHIVTSQITEGKIYIAGSGYSNPGVYVTYDNGENFIPIDSGLPNTMVYEIAVTPDDRFIFAATEVGPYVYSTQLNSWYDMTGFNAPDQTFWSVEYLPDIKTVRFGTYGRGIWDFKITNNTDVAEYKEVSQKLKLSVYPNPQVDLSEIIIESPVEVSCDVKIISNDGKFVKQLFNGIIKKGINTFNWNGSSESGAKLPAGIYLCIANSMGITNYSKIIINK
ncbi:MAG: T9SS type A sorting domain-containing protein [Ignavibacteriae bacterium]|nr:T9SS type A sorting domain-containing protein [Ignavibacteriota bacterium]